MLNKKIIGLLPLLFFYAKGFAQKNKNFVCTAFSGEVVLQMTLGPDSLFSGNFRQINRKNEFVLRESDFTGIYRKNVFIAKFKKMPLPLSKNTKWTDKPWQLISPDRVDTLQIFFLVKDIRTGKWNEEEYDFIEEMEEQNNSAVLLNPQNTKIDE